MAYTPEDLQKFDEMMEKRGAVIGGQNVDVLSEDEVDDATTIPATRLNEQGEATGWYVAPLRVIMKPIRTALSTLQTLITTVTSQGNAAESAASSANTAASTANTAASNADSSRLAIESNESTRQQNETTRQSQESTRQSNEATRQSNESTRQTQETSRENRSSQDHTRAEGDHSTASTDHQVATGDHTQAGQDHSQYQTDHQNVQGAENVNAQLSGYTVTITNRSGQSTSVDIGFEIYRTYTSVASMNADAANVPQGKFVVIATTDATSADNGKMYCKNSAGSFTFLCDLDQASSEAWADWLENMKPQIENAIDDAEDATEAANDAAEAWTTPTTGYQAQITDALTTADNDHTRAGQDHSASETATSAANTQANRAKELADHPPFIGDGTIGDLNYWYVYDLTNHQYVKDAYAKGDDLHWDEMTEQEKEDLADKVKEAIVFASVQECEDAIDELT